jgi:hypothetical protein
MLSNDPRKMSSPIPIPIATPSGPIIARNPAFKPAFTPIRKPRMNSPKPLFRLALARA